MPIYLDTALAEFNQALLQESDLADACHRLGNVLQALGRFEEAMDWHTRAVQQAERAELFAAIGKLYAQQEQWNDAIAAYQHAIRHQPNHAGAYWSLANIYASQGNSSAELEHRLQALTLKPDWATAPNQLALGNLLMAHQRAPEAIAAYRRALSLQPDMPEAAYNLGVALFQQGDWQEAKALFQQTLEQHPDHHRCCLGMTQVLQHEQRYDDAIQYYHRAIALKPNSPGTLYALGELLLQLRRWHEGAEIYRQAIELDPHFSWSHHYLGYALLKQDQVEEAIAAFQQSLSLNVDSAWTHYHLADALCQQQRWSEAIASALAALRLQSELPGIEAIIGRAVRHLDAATLAHYQQQPPTSPDCHNPRFYWQLGRRLANHHQWDGAVLLLKLALTLAPTQQPLNHELAQAQAAQQQAQQAIAVKRQQLQANPNASWAYSQLANLLADQGDLTEAIALNQQANELQGWTQSATKGYQFTRDWFTYNIPIWRKYLQFFAHQPDARALEVGCYEGRSTCWLLDHILTHPTSQILCIDLYFQEKFDVNMQRSGAIDKLTKRQGNSHDLLPTLPINTFDIIYIDGCHLTEHVRIDAVLSWPLLKVGGIMIFDDYELNDLSLPWQVPKPGIDQFLATVSDQVQILHKAYQLIVRKTAAST